MYVQKPAVAKRCNCGVRSVGEPTMPCALYVAGNAKIHKTKPIQIPICVKASYHPNVQRLQTGRVPRSAKAGKWAKVAGVVWWHGRDVYEGQAAGVGEADQEGIEVQGWCRRMGSCLNSMHARCWRRQRVVSAPGTRRDPARVREGKAAANKA